MTIPLLRLGDIGDDPTVYVSAYALDGPGTATVGLPSDQFILTLGAGVLASPVEITLDDGGAGGSFSLAVITLSAGARSRSFTYTGAAAGTVTISVTNDGGLDDPGPLTLILSDPLSPDLITHGPIVMLTPAPARWYRRG